MIDNSIEELQNYQGIRQHHIEWPDPDMDETQLSKAEEIDEVLIPNQLLPYLKELCDTLQVPLASVVPPLFVSLGATIGRQAVVQPKRNNAKFRKSPNLWGGLIGPPSSLKTPIFKDVLKDLRQLEGKSRKEFEEKESQWLVDKSIMDVEMSSLKNRLKRGYENGESIEEFKDKIIELEQKIKRMQPVRKRFLVNDVTPEKLLTILAENPHGLLFDCDELSRLLDTLDKPGYEGFRKQLLEAWNGDGTITTDRIGRGSTTADGMCISILGNIQPTVLSSFVKRQIRNPTNDDGFLQRFQILISTPKRKKAFEYIDRQSDPELAASYARVFNRLSKLGEWGKLAAMPRENDQMIFMFSEDAQELYKEWSIQLENLIASGSDTENLSRIMIEHLGKYRSLMPTLALIYHLVELVYDPTTTPSYISLSAARKAADMCEYLRVHAEYIFDLRNPEVERKVKKLKNEILSGTIKDGQRLRDFRKNRSLEKDTDRMDSYIKAFKLLEDISWLTIEKRKNERGPASEIIRLNPKLSRYIRYQGLI